ncbi:MAG: hypothetical protein ACJA1H_001782 [Glaciecola sp.]|jgi:hypothetical protein
MNRIKILKKPQLFIIILFAFACGPSKFYPNKSVDKKFDLCYKLRHDELISQYDPTIGNLVYKQNIYSLLENMLIQK